MYELSSNAFLDLHELVLFVAKLGPREKQLTTLHELETGNSQEALLYRSLLGHGAHGERAVQKVILGSIPEKRYAKVRSELRAKLLRLVFVLDLKQAKFSEYSQRLNALNRAVMQVKTLATFGSLPLAESLANDYIEEARDLEEWMAGLELLKVLRYRAALSGKRTEFDRYATESERYYELIGINQQALLASERIDVLFARSGAEKPWLKEEIGSALTALRPAIKKYGTFTLQDLSLRLRRKAMQIAMDYDESFRIADESDALLDRFPTFDNRARRYLNAKNKLWCHMQKERYKLAWKEIERCHVLIDHESDNWYYLQEQEFLWCMHTEAFEKARSLCIAVLNTGRFKAQTEASQHTWQLFLLWADFLTGRKVPMEQKSKGEKTGEVTVALLRVVQSFVKDHDGFKLALITLEILILLERRKSKNDILKRIASLKIYRSRHLQHADTLQAKLLIDCLEAIEFCDFDRAKVAKHTSQARKALQASVKQEGLQGTQTMPFVWIVDRAIASL